MRYFFILFFLLISNFATAQNTGTIYEWSVTGDTMIVVDPAIENIHTLLAFADDYTLTVVYYDNLELEITTNRLGEPMIAYYVNSVDRVTLRLSSGTRGEYFTGTTDTGEYGLFDNFGDAWDDFMYFVNLRR